MSSGMLKFSALALAASLGAMNSLSPQKAAPEWDSPRYTGRTASRTSGAGQPGAQKHRAARKAKKKMRKQSRKKK
ncbi:hypothetical protein LU11_gp344 [Pseudomonas phage Lu11]|uniref:hypothetical protein n=1 Tax=Pseudomonas phage Lu11 TaxID=1161927 RepID=UPI00025F1882|nr:hypothetical protein LU11_gp344 [Pseudomonas phage Lu11]AFH14875.1 hypothetical protein Lu11_0337 [Pseudomonas phage Lu11]